MRLSAWIASLCTVVVVAVGLSGPAMPHADAPAAVDQQRLEHADREPGQWMSVGRTWNEQRFSPLKQINAQTVGRLGLAWYAELNTYRGVLATPLEIDGVLYNVSAWDLTTAYDAVTGTLGSKVHSTLPVTASSTTSPPGT